MTTTTPTRRTALGISLTAIAAGLALPALATTTADAELIAACDQIVVAQTRIDALYKVRDTVEAEERTDPELSALYAMQHGRLDLPAVAVPPTTLAGALALARASVAITPLNVQGEKSCDGGDAEWLAFVVVKFLAGSAGA